MNDRYIQRSMANGMRGENMAQANERGSDEGKRATAADSAAQGQASSGSTSGSDASGIPEGKVMGSSCMLWCGFRVNGRVEWCSSGCREFGTWGHDV